MKYLIFIFLVSVCSMDGFCQQSDQANIYLMSLTSHLDYLRSVTKEKLQSVYVERDEYTTESLPNQIDAITITYLTRSEIRDKTRKGERIDLVVIKPVKVEKTLLKVTVIDFSVTSKRNSFNYANGGGSSLEFKYNCEQQKFELSKKKQGGI